MFGTIIDVASEDAVLATNTSTLSITEIAAATDRPERVVGMYFSNPVQLMPIVEVIRGERTSDEVFETATNLGEAIGNIPMIVEKDVPAFLTNCINLRFWLEVVREVDVHVTDTKTADSAPGGWASHWSGIDVVTMGGARCRNGRSTFMSRIRSSRKKRPEPTV